MEVQSIHVMLAILTKH